VHACPGFDLASAYAVTVPARGKAVVRTGLAIAIPENTYARIAPRSGLAVKNFLDTGAGVVDYDYRGEVGVVLFNHSEVDYEVKVGDRVAQLILERISMAGVEEVTDGELFATERGAGGFGSTGVQGAVQGAAEKKPRQG
jgi:dUTP pyrophosphatase